MINDGGRDTLANSKQRLTIVTLLGFSSGMPLALSGSTLQAWYTQAGIDVRTIGMLSLVGLPYVLKFLWAPLLDRFSLSVLGRRRSWMLLSQLGVLISLLMMAYSLPSEQHFALALFALSLAFFSATQDIAIDAYRTEILAGPERGLGVGLAVGAYRVALIIAGAGALFVAHYYDFKSAYVIMACLMSIGVASAYFAPPSTNDEKTMGLREAVVKPFVVFSETKWWGVLLLLIVSYKFGDALAEKMTITFLLREMALTLAEIGAFYKTVGITAAVLGGILGGVLMMKTRLYFSLVLFAVLQMLTNIGFVVLSLIGPSDIAVIVVVIAENLFGGMGTAAFVALVMALCDKRYTATQFALLTAIASLGRVFSGPLAGNLVAAWDWTTFFVFTVAVGLIPLVILPLVRGQLNRLDGET